MNSIRHRLLVILLAGTGVIWLSAVIWIQHSVLASPEGASVEARLERASGRVRFLVLDRDPGIPDSDRPHVTERFWRGAASGQGSGLGLSIVAAAMERIGGELHLSPREGGGEQAEITLPATA